MSHCVRTPILAALLATMALLCGCLEDGALKHRSSTTPELLDDGWSVGSAADHGLDAEGIERATDDFYAPDRFRNALAMLVVHDGELVYETYSRRPEDRERLHHVQSVTKSVTGMVFGIVRGEGHFPDLDAPVASLAPEWFVDHTDKRDITVRHLLTMRSGINFDNSVFSTEIYRDKPANIVDAILSHRMFATAGSEFYYRDCDPHLLSALIEHQTGKTVETWAAERLFEPLGIQNHHWGKDPDGTTMGGHGLSLTARDLARLGQLVLDGGSWHGNPVVPAEWMAEATTLQTESFTPAYGYGFYWWLLPDSDAVVAWGHGGNFIFVVPSKRLVLVMVSLPDVNDDFVGTLLDDFLPLADRFIEATPDTAP